MSRIFKIQWLVYSILISIFLFSKTSQAQRDTLDYSILSWSVDADLTPQPQNIDTALSNFQFYKPFYKYQHYTGVAYTGNLGMAVQPLNFNQRQQQAFIFLNPYVPYLFTEENTQYYNTKQAYSQIQYVTNFTKTNNLQNLDLIYTQNALPYLNFGFRYRMYGADGEYMSQKSKSSALQFFSSYDHLRYKAYLSLNLNNIKGDLNGGIMADSLLNPKNTSVSDTKLIPVRLKASDHHINMYQIAYQQQYLLNKDALPDSLGKVHFPKYILGHHFKLSRYKRVYNLKETTDFYTNFYQGQSPFSQSNLGDSTAMFDVNQEFYIDYLPVQQNFFNRLHLFYQIDYLKHHSFENALSTINQSVGGIISNDSSSWIKWKTRISYTFAGYNRNDFCLKALIYKYLDSNAQHRINLSVSSENTSPNYFFNHFSSHFLKWDSDFKSTQKQNIRFTYQLKKYGLEVGLNYDLYSNYLHFASVNDSIWANDTVRVYGKQNAYPVQSTSSIQVASAFINHSWHWGAFHIHNSLLFQKTNKEAEVHLPTIAWYHSSFFEMRFFKKVLVVQLGFDMRYHTAYYADAFMPATGVFYSQNEIETRDYPFFNVFLNAQIKRVRLFFKMEHINESLMGYHYFPVPHHPHNPRVFRFGLSWQFYN